MKNRYALSLRDACILLLVAALAVLAACAKQQSLSESSATATAQPEVKIDPTTVATLTGVVHFSGTVPKPKRINMSEDPACKGQNADESLVVNRGGLGNVLVYVKDGLPKSRMGAIMVVSESRHPTPTSGIIRQDGCRYEPHVVAVPVGWHVTIYNDDLTTHNIHPMPHNNKEWNQSQAPGAEPITKTFDHPELMIPVKCNVHPWMKAYINVMGSPFYAVTDEHGAFTIQGLPPGTYTIAAVHETLGEQTAQITVGPKQQKQLDFTFSSAPNPASAAR